MGVSGRRTVCTTVTRACVPATPGKPSGETTYCPSLRTDKVRHRNPSTESTVLQVTRLFSNEKVPTISRSVYVFSNIQCEAIFYVASSVG